MSVIRSPSAASMTLSDIPPYNSLEPRVGPLVDPKFARLRQVAPSEDSHTSSHHYTTGPSASTVGVPERAKPSLCQASSTSAQEVQIHQRWPTPADLPSSRSEGSWSSLPPPITSVPPPTRSQTIIQPPQPPLSDRDLYLREFWRTTNGFDFTRERTSDLVPDGTDLMELIKQQSVGFKRATEEMRRHIPPSPSMLPPSGLS